jgi:hypothetical protein
VFAGCEFQVAGALPTDASSTEKSAPSGVDFISAVDNVSALPAFCAGGTSGMAKAQTSIWSYPAVRKAWKGPKHEYPYLKW